jgi:hypothetical protein
MTYKGIAKGKIIELDEALPYSEGQPVSVSVEPFRPEIRPGSVPAILNVLRQLPPISREDVDELEHAIEQGKLPVRTRGVFGGEEPDDRR